MLSSRIVRRSLHRESWGSLVPHPVLQYLRPLRASSTVAKSPSDISEMLEKPSWSVKTLLKPKNVSSMPGPSITKTQLHHLLRLSALPLPASEEEEAKMMEDLEAQLRFVQAVQRVDTKGVKPLQSIRDETIKGQKLSAFTVKSLKAEFDKEMVVGKRGRIIKRKNLPPVDEERLTNWDPLAQAPKRLERYFVVETDTD